jgi:hypothetical protein
VLCGRGEGNPTAKAGGRGRFGDRGPESSDDDRRREGPMPEGSGPRQPMTKGREGARMWDGEAGD